MTPTLEFILGLKGLMYKPIGPTETKQIGDGTGAFFSPQQTGTYWPREGLVEAECGQKKSHLQGCPDPRCSCGIYATFSRSTVMGYSQEDNRAVFLLQGWPRFIVGSADAWRASAASVIAVIQLPLKPVKLTIPKRPVIGDPFPSDGLMTISAMAHPTQNLVGQIAQEYFQVGSISLAVAIEMMERNNARHRPG